MSSQKKGGMFYGWWIVIASCIIMGVVYSPIINLASLWTNSVTTELNVSKTNFMYYYSILALASMFSAPIVGKMLRKYDIRMIMGVGVVLSGLGVIGFSYATSLTMFYILAVPIGMGIAASSMIPPAAAITNWFNEKRGVAFGAAMAGTALGGGFISPWITGIITASAAGWRTAYLYIGIMMIVIALPLVIFVIKISPAQMGMVALGEKQSSVPKIWGVTEKEAKSSLSFWALCGGIIITGIAINSLTTAIAPILISKGYTPALSAVLLSISLYSVAFGKIIVGKSYDSLGSIKTLILIVVASVGMVISLKAASATVTIFGIVYALLAGFAGTNVTVTPSFLTGSLFGNKEYGGIYGVISIFSSLGAALGPIVSGIVVTNFGGGKSYDPVLNMCLILSVLAFCLFYVAVKTKPKFEIEKRSEKIIVEE